MATVGPSGSWCHCCPRHIQTTCSNSKNETELIPDERQQFVRDSYKSSEATTECDVVDVSCNLITKAILHNSGGDKESGMLRRKDIDMFCKPLAYQKSFETTEP